LPCSTVTLPVLIIGCYLHYSTKKAGLKGNMTHKFAIFLFNVIDLQD